MTTTHRPRPRAARRIALLAALGAGMLALAGCGADDPTPTGTGDGEGADAAGPLVVYSGRNEEFAGPVFERFSEETGIELEVRYAGSPELAATLQEEGEASPADVFFAQDAGAIGVVADQLAALPEDVLGLVSDSHRADDGTWVGVTGRVRTAVYRTGDDGTGELPDSIYDLTDPAWEGRVGIAPGNASFQAHVSAMRLVDGDERVSQWLEGLRDNGVRTYEKNGLIVDATRQGEIDLGLVNHYYLFEKLSEDPEAPIATHFFAAGDSGTFTNVSAVGILATSTRPEQALALVEFLLGEAQALFAAGDEKEYPLVPGTPWERPDTLPALEELDGLDVTLNDLDTALAGTVEILRASGLLTD